MSDFAAEDDVFFPPALVGRPTSEVLKHLAEKFKEFAAETEVLEEKSDGLCTGYLYAEYWMRNWALDAEKVEEERRRKAR